MNGFDRLVVCLIFFLGFGGLASNLLHRALREGMDKAMFDDLNTLLTFVADAGLFLFAALFVCEGVSAFIDWLDRIRNRP